MIKIAPSLLAADSARLGEAAAALEKAGADLLHFDVMDGHFVPNLTFGPQILKHIKKYTSLLIDVHLMVTNPLEVIPWYAEAGADFITFHLEATDKHEKAIKLIKKYGIKAGITLRPDSDIKQICPYLSLVDMVLVMAVNPGFCGQRFREDTPDKIRFVNEYRSTKNILIEVDGGINKNNARICAQAGADILVAGTSVFADNKYAENIKLLRG